MSDSFVSVSFNWRYSIDIAPLLTANPVRRTFATFEPQPDHNCWLMSLEGKKDFRLLTGEQVVKLLNEGIRGGLFIWAQRLDSGNILYFQNTLQVEPIKKVYELQA